MKNLTTLVSDDYLLEDALERLEWKSVLEALIIETAFISTKEILSKLEPNLAILEREWFFDSIEEYLKKEVEGINLILIETDFSFLVQLKINAVLSGLSLYELYKLTEMMQNAHKYIKDNCDGLLSNLLKQITILPKLHNSLKLSIDFSGNILSSASIELKSLRDKYENIKKKILITIEGLLQKSSIKNALQDNIWMQKNGRYVLPVRTDRRSEIQGVVHGFSNTGSTIFVEPQELHQLQINLENAETEIKIEENRILRKLSEEAHLCYEQLINASELLIKYDLVKARAKFANRLNGCRPIFDNKCHTFSILQAKHPLFLLENKYCVPNDLILESSERYEKPHIWVLTGPNAGGKTVAMRTVGLAVFMAKAGLFVSAVEAHFKEFDHVYVELGDRQSREEDLSTFSGHLLHVKNIVNNATSRSLVLLDEGFVGTDPQAGMALARSTLEYLANKEVTVIITTHFSNLKVLANTDKRFLNASMEFEAHELRPTYTILNGFPGQSYALELAMRINFPNDIIIKSKEYLGDETQKIENLLKDLQRKKAELTEEYNNQYKLRQKMEHELEEVKFEKQLFLEQRNKLVDSYKIKLQKRLNAYENRLFVREKQFDKELQKMQKQKISDIAYINNENINVNEHNDNNNEIKKEPLEKGTPKTIKKMSNFSDLQNLKLTTKLIIDEEIKNTDKQAEQFRKPKQFTTRSLIDEASESLMIVKNNFDKLDTSFKNEYSQIIGIKEENIKKIDEKISIDKNKEVKPKEYWQKGMRVRHHKFNEIGEVLQYCDAKGLIECRFGILKIKLMYQELKTIQIVANKTNSEMKIGNQKKNLNIKNDNTIDLAIEGVFQFSNNTIDVRGKLVEESLAEISDFIDKSLRNNIDKIIIIHGHGTGKVKQAVREYLPKISYDLTFRPGTSGEGGDGATVVKFK